MSDSEKVFSIYSNGYTFSIHESETVHISTFSSGMHKISNVWSVSAVGSDYVFVIPYNTEDYLLINWRTGKEVTKRCIVMVRV